MLGEAGGAVRLGLQVQVGGPVIRGHGARETRVAGEARVTNGGSRMYGEVGKDVGEGELEGGVTAAITLEGGAAGMQVPVGLR